MPLNALQIRSFQPENTPDKKTEERGLNLEVFRSTASTLLNESGLWHPDAIERALAHGDSNAVRGTYNRGQYWDERVKMAQWWSDYLDDLRANKGSV